MAAFVTGGLGLAALTVGVPTGEFFIVEKSVIAANCDGPACSAAGKGAADRVKALGLASILGITAGRSSCTAGGDGGF